MLRHTHRRGPLGSIVVPATLGVVIVTFLTLGLLSSKRYSSFQPAATSTRVPPATELIATTARAGLDPDSLLAAGVPTSQYAGVLTAVRDYVAAHPTTIADADAAVARAQRSARLARHQAPTSTPAVIDTMHQRDAAFQTLFDAATAVLTADQRSILLSLKANKERPVPLAYRAVARTDEEWTSLRNALADEAIATREHRDVDANVRAVLANARANIAVSGALSRLVNGTAASRAALSAAANTATRTR